LLNFSVSQDFKLFRSANSAAEGKDSTLGWVSVRRWMCNAKRAVNAITVFKRRLQSSIVLLMAWITKVSRSKAAIEGCGATKLALPVNLLSTMLFASSCARANFLKETVLTQKIFLLCVMSLSVSHLLLAVYESTEVRLFACVTLVKRAAMKSKLLWFTKVGITFC
jgi:hypothetical protein